MATKVVKVKVTIVEDDVALRNFKYDYVRESLKEGLTLGNEAIAAYFGMDRGLIPHIRCEDTEAYDRVKVHRKFVTAASSATTIRSAGQSYRSSKKNRRGIPNFMSPTLAIPSKGTTINAQQGANSHASKEFFFTLSCFPAKMNPDAIASLIAKNVEIEARRLKSAEALAKKEKKPLSYSPRPYPAAVSDVPPDKQSIVFKSLFSWKDDGAIAVVNRIVSKEYKLCDSEITNKDGTMFLFLTYGYTPEAIVLDPEKVCGIDMGVKIPMVCAVYDPHAVNKTWSRLFLGNETDIWSARSRFRAIRRRNQSRGMRSWKSHQESSVDKAEGRWIRNYCHNLTSRAIEFCIKGGYGTIHLENLRSLRERQKKCEYQMLMWVPSLLREMLKAKAEAVGIKVKEVDPAYTSQKCSVCGHADKANRVDQSNFKCVKCGEEFHADYNAARNIAKAKPQKSREEEDFGIDVQEQDAKVA